MLRMDLRDEYIEKSGQSGLYATSNVVFGTNYIMWLEDQLIAPCKSCQNLQGQVIRQEARIRELESMLNRSGEQI